MNSSILITPNAKEAGKLYSIIPTDGSGDLSFGKGIHEIVEIGQIIDKEPIFDADFTVIQEATYLDGYHFDVMSEIEIDFGVNATTPTNPKHSFAGYEVAN